MGFKGDKKYIHWGLTAFSVIAACILLYFGLAHVQTIKEAIKSFFNAIEGIIFGLVISYLLCPILNYIELHIFNKNKFHGKAKKRIRMITIVLTICIFVGLLYGLFSLIIPELVISITKISKSYKDYQRNFEETYYSIIDKYPDINNLLSDNAYEKIVNYLSSSILPKLDDIVKSLTTGIYSAFRVVFNLVIGLIMAVYLLYNKELFTAQSKKALYALMKRSTANNFIHNLRYINKTFQNFLIGKLIDSILIGFICFICTTILDMPYTLLISVIIGITNIIPLFGPFIGAVPSAFLVLMVDPKKCIIFIILIIILQQFDGNVLGPKIIGSSTGLSGFWVLVSITLFGAWFGLIGWIVGVPLFAVIYTTSKAYINARLTDKNLATTTDNYMYMDFIDDDHNYIKIPKEQVQGMATKFKSINPINLIRNTINKNIEENSEITVENTDKEEENK